MWSVQVDDQPIEVREATHGYQVPLLRPTPRPNAVCGCSIGQTLASWATPDYTTDRTTAGHSARQQRGQPIVRHPLPSLVAGLPAGRRAARQRRHLHPTVEMQDDTFFGHIRKSITLPSWESLRWHTEWLSSSSYLLLEF
ncbi:MAG: hypothetical protein R3B91_18175 [Planctomycetaceae bacterium]